MKKDAYLSAEKIMEIKIEKGLEFICPLFKENFITDAYIVGSVAEGKANQYSDTDINIVNPLFGIHDFHMKELNPDIIETLIIKEIIDKLKNIGVKFKYIKRKDSENWYQIYKDELFHIMLIRDIPNKPSFQIKRDICQWFL